MLAGGLAQAEHRGRAGVLQPAGRHEAASRPRPAPGQWGSALVVRVRAVRPRVQGLHGAGVVRAEAVPPRADGDVGRDGRAVAGRRSRPPRLARRRDQRRGARRGDRATTRTTRSVRCSTTCCCTRRSSGSRRRSSSQLAGETRPDVVIGSCGGGSNLGGIALPFMTDADGAAARGRARVVPDAHRRQVRVRLRRHRGDDAAAADVHARPRLRAAVDPRRRPALPRRLADHLAARAGRPHGRGRVPAGQDVRGRGAVRAHRGQDPGARDRPRDPRRDRRGARRQGERARSA